MRNIEFVPKAFEEHRLIYKITDTQLLFFPAIIIIKNKLLLSP